MKLFWHLSTLMFSFVYTAFPGLWNMLLNKQFWCLNTWLVCEGTYLFSSSPLQFPGHLYLTLILWVDGFVLLSRSIYCFVCGVATSRALMVLWRELQSVVFFFSLLVLAMWPTCTFWTSFRVKVKKLVLRPNFFNLASVKRSSKWGDFNQKFADELRANMFNYANESRRPQQRLFCRS